MAQHIRQAQPQAGDDRRQWRTAETIALVWLVLALASIIPLVNMLGSGLPIFTFVWLIVPLGVLLRTRDASRIGMGYAPPGDVLKTAGLMLAALMVIWLAFEPWTHAYRSLVRLALEEPDMTFAWLVRLDGPAGWLGMVLTSGLVTIFGEELFFRGWLLNLFRERMGVWAANALQAALFSIPQAIVALFFPPLNAVLFIAVYSWLAIGMVGGWAAARTRTIWPSLIAATISNLVLTLIILLA